MFLARCMAGVEVGTGGYRRPGQAMVPVGTAVKRGPSFALERAENAVLLAKPVLRARCFPPIGPGRYYWVPMSGARSTSAAAPPPKKGERDSSEAAARKRILEAAFTAFVKHGFAQASMLEIATQARVSKRELYALVGNKEQMLVACIQTRAQRLQAPSDLPSPRDREALRKLLVTFGTQLVREVSDPTVVATFRLAIAEAVHAPEVARALDSIGRETVRAAVRKIMAEAAACGLLQGRPAELSERFGALLWGDLTVALLLGVAQQPKPREIARRARDAADAFLQLHPPT